jgi:hypothetical protein
VVVNLPTKYKYKKGGQVKASRFVKEVKKTSNEEILDVVNSLRATIGELSERVSCISMDVEGELSAVSDELSNAEDALIEIEELLEN